MSQRFVDRIVVVTGAAAGLGRVSALAFAREGAHLVLTDLNEPGLQETAAHISRAGGQCSIHCFDLASESEINEFGAQICTRHPKVHVLYNNAGLHLGEATQSVESIGLQKWLHYLTVNCLAPLLLAQALRPSLANARGVVLNQSSMASYVPATIYGVTKATMNSLTYGMASAFGKDGIRVNAIAPGMMETAATKAQMSPEHYARIQEMQMIKVHGAAEDIANLALFLASDDARFIDAEVVSCDAGSRIRGWRG